MSNYLDTLITEGIKVTWWILGIYVLYKVVIESVFPLPF